MATLNVYIARSKKGKLSVWTTGYKTAKEVSDWLIGFDDELVWFRAFGDTPKSGTMDEMYRDKVASGLAGFCDITNFAAGLESILTEIVLAAEAEGRRRETYELFAGVS